MRNGRCPVAETLDEPLVVVKINEVGDLSPCLVEILEVEEPEAFFLHGPHEALGHTVALGLGDEGVGEFDSEPARLAFEDVSSATPASLQRPRFVPVVFGPARCGRQPLIRPSLRRALVRPVITFPGEAPAPAATPSRSPRP